MGVGRQLLFCAVIPSYKCQAVTGRSRTLATDRMLLGTEMKSDVHGRFRNVTDSRGLSKKLFT